MLYSNRENKNTPKYTSPNSKLCNYYYLIICKSAPL